MKCPNCNKEIPNDLRFCIYCGSNTASSTEQKIISKGKLNLSQKYSSLNFRDFSHANYKRLKAAEQELKQDDPGIAQELLLRVQKAIKQCDSYYQKENELLATIRQEEKELSITATATLIVKNFLLYWILGIIAFAYLNGWFMWLVCFGCFCAPFYEVGDKIKEKRASLNCHKEELRSLQHSLGGTHGKSQTRNGAIHNSPKPTYSTHNSHESPLLPIIGIAFLVIMVAYGWHQLKLYFTEESKPENSPALQNEISDIINYPTVSIPTTTLPEIIVTPETTVPETIPSMMPTTESPPTTEPPAAQTELVGCVLESSGGLNIRSGPGVDYEQVGRLAPNEKVVILNTQQVGQYTWGQIHNGWIRMDYITYEEPAGGSTSGSSSVRTGYVIESSGGLKVRSGPGQDYAEIGRLAPNDQVTIYESTVIGTSNWGRIGKGQWVCIDYVVFSDDAIGTTNILSFNSIPKEYIFTSGAGGWGTNLTIANDGSFTGNYHDSEMGVVGEGYPHGTVYYCNFSGKFSTPIKVNDYTYKMKLETLTVADPVGYEYIQNGTRYIASEPYGFDGPNEYYIYLPGIPSSMIPQSAYEWVSRLYDGTNQVYVICSAKGELPFMGT